MPKKTRKALGFNPEIKCPSCDSFETRFAHPNLRCTECGYTFPGPHGHNT